jgi:hypothetical protein
MQNTRNFEENAYWNKKLGEDIRNATHKKMFWQNRIKGLKKIYHENIVERDKITARRNWEQSHD